jgi:signal peptidase II
MRPPRESAMTKAQGGQQWYRIGLLISAIAVVLDQVSKFWILYSVMAPPRVIEVTPFFNLVLAWNKGISFGMFNTGSTYGPLLLTGLAIVIVIALCIWLWRADTKWVACALGLVIGGAVGNVIDRVRFGAVVDFLDVHAFGYHWPAFNVADSAICVGAAILILESLFRPSEKA